MTITRALLSLSLFAFPVAACAVETDENIESIEVIEQPARGGNKPICALKCAAPPEGCHYENAVLTGPCNKLTCGDLVCDDSAQ